MHELDEGFLEHPEVMPVGGHVILVDVGDHGGHGFQLQERGIALVRFGDDVAADPEPRVAARAVEQTADDEGGVEPRPPGTRT